MAKKRMEWSVSWPWLAGGAVLAVVVVMAVLSQGGEGTVSNYSDVVKNGDLAAQYRGREKAAENDARTHEKMADYYGTRMESATEVGETVRSGAAMVGEKVQEGTANVREEFNATMADYHNGQMEEGISETLPVTTTTVQ